MHLWWQLSVTCIGENKSQKDKGSPRSVTLARRVLTEDVTDDPKVIPLPQLGYASELDTSVKVD